VPLYEFRCGACGESFERLVRGSDVGVCARCGSADLERQTSLFAVSSEATRKASLGTAKEKQRAEARDKAIAEREQHINHHH
jgi:putative FmdB family regulatory protein